MTAAGVARMGGGSLLRLMRMLLRLTFGLAVAAAVVLCGLAWRLSSGPLDVTGLAQRAAAKWVPMVAADHVTLAWDGLHGREHALHIVVSGVRLTGQTGQIAASADQAAVALSATRLLIGQVAPREIVVAGLRLHAGRLPDGTVTLVGETAGEGPGEGPVLAELASPPSARGSALSELTHVAISDAQIDVDDQTLGKSWTAGALSADLSRQRHGGLTGHAEAALTLGSLTSHASLDASLLAGAAATRLRATVSPTSPAALAHLVPALAPLAALDAPVGLTAEAELGPDLALQHASLHAEAGPGVALLPANKGGTSPGKFASLTLDMAGNLDAVTVQALRIVLAPPSGAPSSTITLSGDAARTGGRVVAHLRADLDRVAFADLGAVWPDRVGGGARPWVAENIDGGTAHDGHFNLTLQGSDDLSDLALTAATGSITGDDVVLHWLRPVPPIEHAHAVLQLLDPDTIMITATGGRTGNIVMRPSTMRIWGLSTKDQFGLVTTDLAAPIADVFTLLRHPRLNLLSRHPLPISSPSGSSVTHMTVYIPLEAKVDFDSIAIHAQSTLTDVHLGGIAAGKSLEHGALALDVTNDGLKLTGTAALAGLPSTLAVDMDFRLGPPSQVLQHAVVTTRADAKALAAAGLDAAGVLVGAVSAKVDYAERRDAQATILLDADLREAGVNSPFGWSKTAGTVGHAEAHVALDHGRLVGIQDLQANAPGLSVVGRSEMVNGRPAVLHIDRGVIGRTEAVGTIRFPLHDGDPLQVSLSGPRLDLSSQLDSSNSDSPVSAKAAGAARRSDSGLPYDVALRFNEVLAARGSSLGQVSLDAVGRGRRITRAQFTSGGVEQIRASVVPDGTTRRVSVATANLGRVLQDFGLARELEEGALTLDGRFDDRVASEPFTGTMTLSHFRVRGAPWAGKLLQGMTLYGLVDALRGPGLVFDRLSTPFSIDSGIIYVQHARTYSSSLGVTAQGWLDFHRQTMDLRGTIVPAYFFNTLPGRMPLIGHLLSPEPGGGLFAATYSLRGPIDSPAVGVNPLAALTPGALRGLFRLFD